MILFTHIKTIECIVIYSRFWTEGSCLEVETVVTKVTSQCSLNSLLVRCMSSTYLKKEERHYFCHFLNVSAVKLLMVTSCRQTPLASGHLNVVPRGCLLTGDLSVIATDLVMNVAIACSRCLDWKVKVRYWRNTECGESFSLLFSTPLFIHSLQVSVMGPFEPDWFWICFNTCTDAHTRKPFVHAVQYLLSG